MLNRLFDTRGEDFDQVIDKFVKRYSGTDSRVVKAELGDFFKKKIEEQTGALQ